MLNYIVHVSRSHNQGRQTDEEALDLEVLLYRVNVVEDEGHDRFESVQLLQRLQGRVHVVPNVHHQALHDHIFELGSLSF